MIEADPCTQANCKLDKTRDQHRTANGQGADFLAHYEQTEVDYQEFGIAIGINTPSRLDQNTNNTIDPASVSSAGANLSVPVRAGALSPESEAVATEQKPAKPGPPAAHPAPETAPISPKPKADWSTNSAAANAAGSAHKPETAVIATPEPGAWATRTEPVVSQRATALHVPGQNHIQSDPQLAHAEALPAGPAHLGAHLSVSDIEGLLTVASERSGAIALEASSAPLQLASVPGQSAIAMPATSQTSAPQTIVTAAPAEIVDIIAQSLSATDERKDRIIVQLDPPELGRVSIDFKFDAQGLQHITITGETPEALRRLRMMHYDLIQTLERDGLTGQGMTFRQQNTPQNSRSDGSAQQATASNKIDEPATTRPVTSPVKTTPLSITGSGLNVKL